MYSLSLKFRITALALFVAFFPLTALQIIDVERTSSALSQSYKEHLEQRSIQIADELNRYIQQRVTDIIALSKAGEFYSGKHSSIARYIHNIKEAHPVISSVAVINKDGVVTVSTNKKQEDHFVWEVYLGVKELFLSTMAAPDETVYISEASFINDDPVILLLTPIFNPDAKKIIGALLFKVSLKQANKIIDDYNAMEKKGANTYIVDKLGNIVITTNSGIKNYSKFDDVKLQPAMLSNNSHGVLQYINKNEMATLAGYSDMREFGQNRSLDWSVISIFPVNNIVNPANENRSIVFIIGIGLTAFVTLVAYYFARGIALPLQRVAIIAEEICRGDYSHRLEANMGGEIGSLATAINEMADRIEERTDEIINRNEKLTSEITERKLAEDRLKQLSHKIIRLQEEERRRVSRELHDGINQLLVSVKYKLENYVDKHHGPSNQADAENLKDIMNAVVYLEDVIAEVRRISHDLRPSVLDDLGLSAAIQNIARQFHERNLIDVEIEGIDDEILTRLPADVETALYRIVQEALTNIEKYANATKVVINMTHTAINVTIRIEDDGEGFDLQQAMRKPSSSSGGMGLRNMRERIELLQGSFFIHSEEGKGTFIEVKAPLNLE